MRPVFYKRIIVIVGLISTLPLYGQGLQETLETMLEENAKGYLGPVVTAFGTGVNSGTFHTARSHKMMGFDITFNVSVVGVPEAGQEYDFYIPDIITLPFVLDGTTYDIEFDGSSLYSRDRKSSTFFGDETSHEITADGTYVIGEIKRQLVDDYGISEQVADAIPASEFDTTVDVLTINTPKGFGFPALPMVMPQVSVGLPMDIEVTLRGFPKADLGDAGELSFFGFGGKIGLTQFIPIPMFPVQLSAGYYLTSLKLGDVLESNHSIMTLQASKSIPFLTVYGGFGLESSSMDVNYTYVDENNNEYPVSFSLDGDNTFRTIVGLRLKLAVISINADYNIGEYSTVNLGFGLTIR